MEIDIWDLKSFDKAIRKLEKEKPLLNQRTATFVQRLGKIGLDSASKEYAQAKYAGNNDVRVDMWEGSEPHGYTATLVASGNAVYFVEYGAGIFMPDDYAARHELEAEDPTLVVHGSYGKKMGANPHGWNYIGQSMADVPDDAHRPKGTYYMKRKSEERGMPIVHTRGQEATPAMYHAKKKMEKRIDTTARRVFR